jgi:hypothetical protein
MKMHSTLTPPESFVDHLRRRIKEAEGGVQELRIMLDTTESHLEHIGDQYKRACKHLWAFEEVLKAEGVSP